MSRVCLLRRENYEINALIEAVDSMFTAFGLYEKVSPGRKVFIQPNLVMRSAPEGPLSHIPIWWRLRQYACKNTAQR